MRENETSEGQVIYLFIIIYFFICGKGWVEFGNIVFGLNEAQ